MLLLIVFINGMLSGFRLDNLGKPSASNATKFKYRYNCLMNPNITRGGSRSSSWVGAWDISTCGGKKKSWSGGKSTRAANWRFLAQLPMDCGDNFISKWNMETNGTDQESGKDLGNYDMKVNYTCTNEETSDSSLCVEKSTVDVGGERCTISEFQKQNVQCPTGMAITKVISKVISIFSSQGYCLIASKISSIASIDVNEGVPPPK